MLSASANLACHPGRFDSGACRSAWLLGAVVILAFAGSSAYDAWRSYRYALTATDREIGNMAKALAEQTAWTLQTVDLLLLDTARWYRTRADDTPRAAVNAALAARTAGVTPVSQIMIMAADGQQLHRARRCRRPCSTSPTAPISWPRETTRTGSVHQRTADDANRWPHRRGAVAPASRTLRAILPAIVIARVDLEDFSQLYRAVNGGSRQPYALIQEDGTLLVRDPPAPNAVGGRFPSLAADTAAALTRR